MERQSYWDPFSNLRSLALCSMVGGIIIVGIKPTLLPLGFFVGLVYGGLGLSLRPVFVRAMNISHPVPRGLLVGAMSLVFPVFALMTQLFLGTMLLAAPPFRLLFIFAQDCNTGTDMMLASFAACPSALGATLLSIILDLRFKNTERPAEPNRDTSFAGREWTRGVWRINWDVLVCRTAAFVGGLALFPFVVWWAAVTLPELMSIWRHQTPCAIWESIGYKLFLFPEAVLVCVVAPLMVSMWLILMGGITVLQRRDEVVVEPEQLVLNRRGSSIGIPHQAAEKARHLRWLGVYVIRLKGRRILISDAILSGHG